MKVKLFQLPTGEVAHIGVTAADEKRSDPLCRIKYEGSARPAPAGVRVCRRCLKVAAALRAGITNIEAGGAG